MGPTARAIALTLASGFLITVSDALTKLVAATIPLGQIVLTQGLVVAGALLVVGAMRGRPLWRDVANPRLQALRVLLNIIAMVLFLQGLVRLPLAVASTLAFTSPLFVQLIAPRLAGERLDARRIAAVLLGFAGVAVALDPTVEGITLAVLFPLGTALTSAVRDLVTRRLSATDPSETTMFWAGMGSVAAGLVWSGGTLVWPNTAEALLLGVLATAYAASLYGMIEGLRLAQASTLAPFRYAALVWAVLFDFALWGRQPGWSVLVGAAMIVAALAAVPRVDDAAKGSGEAAPLNRRRSAPSAIP